MANKSRKVNKTWWVNLYDIRGELVLGNPFPTYERAILESRPHWVATVPVKFEYTEGEPND